MTEEEKVAAILDTKTLRKELDELLQKIKSSPHRSAERNLAVRKLQESIMWLGMQLKEVGAIDPYPNSKDPSNSTVDPTADGLKL